MLPGILIVDDEAAISAALANYLDDHEEFRVRVAPSGEEALEALRSEPAALCVVDLRLPGMHGAEFIRLAASEGTCGAFVVHTGSAGPVLDETLEGLGLTEHDVFRKPCGGERLLARIRHLLETPRRG